MRTDHKPSGNGAPTSEPLLLTLREVAVAMQISERTAWALADRGDLPSVRIGRLLRFRPETVAAYLQRLESK